MPGVQIITIGGRKTLFIDAAGMRDTKEIAALLRSAKQPAGVHAPESIFSLLDVTGTRFNSDVIAAAREISEHNRGYVKAGAIVGLNALGAAAFTSVMHLTRRTNMRAFDTMQAARDWLASNG